MWGRLRCSPLQLPTLPLLQMGLPSLAGMLDSSSLGGGKCTMAAFTALPMILCAGPALREVPGCWAQV